MPNSNRRSRSVTFTPTTMIVHHISILDMTDEEIRSTWILPHERQSAQQDAKDTIKCMRHCPSQVIEENGMCERGLEHHRTPAMKRTREAIKRSVCNAVLDEQEDQQENSWTSDPEAIRQASLYISRASTERALRLAEADAEHARSAQMSACVPREEDAAKSPHEEHHEEAEMSSLSNAISRHLVMTKNRASTKVLSIKKSSASSKKNAAIAMSNIVDSSIRNPWSNMAA